MDIRFRHIEYRYVVLTLITWRENQIHYNLII